MSKDLTGLFTSTTNEWATPQTFYNKLNKMYNFTLDPCSTKENAKCDLFYTVEENGLTKSWAGHNVFMNPPYGRAIKDWIKKAYEESTKANTLVIALIPARTDTSYWHKYCMRASEIFFVKGRLKFGLGKGSAPFPSAVVVFGQTDFDGPPTINIDGEIIVHDFPLMNIITRD